MAPPPAPEQAVYSLHGFGCGYTVERVLQGLEWTLGQGDSFAILGPSGAGKTLLVKALAGLVPYCGSLRYFGQELRSLAPAELRAFRRSIGVTFQKDGLFDSLTCGDNLRMPLRERLRLSVKEREKRVDRALEEVGLKGQASLGVHEMSGGMQKRLGIARALLFSPRVILYDEPAAGLDPITARSINDLILQMRDQYKMSLVLVTSDLAQAKYVCAKMGLLWHGRFEEVDTFAALKRSKNAAVHQFFNALSDGPLSAGRPRGEEPHDRV